MIGADDCRRCEGSGSVPVVLFVDDYGDPALGSVDCPRCGGSGREPDPDEQAERRALYGPEGGETY